MSPAWVGRSGIIACSLALAVAFTLLVPAKAPWVDELYTWYGVRHETFRQFVDSISSGINFSPPLYFFLNWLGQTVLPFSLDGLRAESLLCILAGSWLCYRATREVFGPVAASLGVATILLQSNLLAEQAIEARHYGMLFFAGSAVLASGVKLIERPACRKAFVLHFLSHLALCLTHYLGIVFSVCAAIVHVYTTWKNKPTRRIPIAAPLAWSLALPMYFLLLQQQTSHLNTWIKPNAFADLASVYLDSFQPLALALPFLAILMLGTTKNPPTQTPAEEASRRFLLILSLLWIALPTGAWLLSHFSPMNLFKDRYYIPKDAAWMVLLSYLFAKLPSSKSLSWRGSLPFATLLLIGLTLLGLTTKRFLFALEPSRNYHHWLLVEERIRRSSLPKVYAGDHLYFPNMFISKQPKSCLLLLGELEQESIYRRFNPRIQTTTIGNKTPGIKHHFLIAEKNAASISNDLDSTLYRITDSAYINEYSRAWTHHVERVLD